MYVRSNLKDYGAFNGKEERIPGSEARVRKSSQRAGFGGDARRVEIVSGRCFVIWLR